MRLGDLDALKDVIEKRIEHDNAEDFDKGYKQAIIDGKTNFSRPQGEWKHEIICDKSCVLCSICNLHFDNESNFCPNCGADMKGGAE